MNQPAHLFIAKPVAPPPVGEHIDASLSADGRTLTIGVSGAFDFTKHRDFRRAYEDQAVNVSHYVVDLRATTSVDSAMLGMMLLMRDHAGRRKATLEIRNAAREISRQLTRYGFTMPFGIA